MGNFLEIVGRAEVERQRAKGSRTMTNEATRSKSHPITMVATAGRMEDETFFGQCVTLRRVFNNYLWLTRETKLSRGNKLVRTTALRNKLDRVKIYVEQTRGGLIL